MRIVDATGTAEPYATYLVGMEGILDHVDRGFLFVRRRQGEIGYGDDAIPLAGMWRVTRVERTAEPNEGPAP